MMGQILVVGDNEFFNDQAAGGVESNLNFIINGIDYLSGDKELIEIRSRGASSRPLDELSKINTHILEMAQYLPAKYFGDSVWFDANETQQSKKKNGGGDVWQIIIPG